MSAGCGTLSCISPRGGVVIIDSGHGGDDPGACKAGVNEAAAAYDVACRLKRNLEARGFRVEMTVKDPVRGFAPSNASVLPRNPHGVFTLNGTGAISTRLGLGCRTKIAQLAKQRGEKVLAYISIHFDESTNPNLFGAHFIVTSDKKGRFGNYLRDEFKRTGLIRQLNGAEYHPIVVNGSRMIAVRNLFVLNNSHNPVEEKVLAELGNINSPRDRKLMSCPKGRQKYADTLGKAIARL